MNTSTERLALMLEPTVQPFTMVPVMIALKDHDVFDSWLAARDFVLDLDLVSPQVVWVQVDKSSALIKALAASDIKTSEISRMQAERIAIENKPVRGDIKVIIRMPGDEINQTMVEKLKSQKLISHTMRGDNADGLYHWKDDRWYQDYILFAFKAEDVPRIEKITKDYYCSFIGIKK